MLLDKLTSLFSSGASKVVDSIGDALDKNFTNKQEREAAKLEVAKEINRHFEAVQNQAKEIYQAELKDLENARNREIQIAISDKAPLINKIIQPIIAIIIVVATLIIWALILFRNYEPKINEAMIIGSLTTLTGMVLSYYFGSSTGSASKQKELEALRK